jgi:hypothetical protein
MRLQAGPLTAHKHLLRIGDRCRSRMLLLQALPIQALLRLSELRLLSAPANPLGSLPAELGCMTRVRAACAARCPSPAQRAHLCGLRTTELASSLLRSRRASSPHARAPTDALPFSRSKLLGWLSLAARVPVLRHAWPGPRANLRPCPRPQLEWLDASECGLQAVPTELGHVDSLTRCAVRRAYDSWVVRPCVTRRLPCAAHSFSSPLPRAASLRLDLAARASTVMEASPRPPCPLQVGPAHQPAGSRAGVTGAPHAAQAPVSAAVGL